MNKKEIAQQFMRACRSFSEGGKQMLDPNQPSISFEQVTNMLKEIEQAQHKVMLNTEVYRIQYWALENLYSQLHSKLQGLHKPIENLEERLTTSSTQLSKYQQSSLWQRYWTATAVGIISALITNIIWRLVLW
jgi:hypothetical protein